MYICIQVLMRLRLCSTFLIIISEYLHFLMGFEYFATYHQKEDELFYKKLVFDSWILLFISFFIKDERLFNSLS